jgi:hypothetical protein
MLVKPLLLGFFERVENFLSRLQSYTETPSAGAMSDIIMEVMVEMFSILAVATTEIKQARICKLIPSRRKCGLYLFSRNMLTSYLAGRILRLH